MASYIGSNQELLCPICASFYNTPRKLQGCVHSFCEKCIVTLLQNFKRDDKLGGEFECPVCRLPSKSPENDTTDISKWVQELDIDKELQTKVGKQNEQDAKWCSQCRYVEKFIRSEVYCSTCQDSYCGNCSEMLHSFKMNRDHAIIDIKADGENENLNEQAVQLLQKFITCSVHPDRSVEFICYDHESFCCATCMTSGHQGCKCIVELKDFKRNSDDDDDDDDDKNDPVPILSSLSKLNEHIKSIINLMREKSAETKTSPEKLRVEFQGIKDRVIRLLDAAEEQLAQDSKALAKATSIKILDDIESLNAVISEIDVISYLLGTLVPKLPDASVMVCCTNAKVMLQELERKILERGSSFDIDELQLKTGEKFNPLINLGPNETNAIISVESNAKSYPLPKLNEKFLLREGTVKKVGMKCNCISDISPGKRPGYNSITILPDNSLVLTDSYYGICLLLDATYAADSISFKVNEVTNKSPLNGNFIHSAYMENDVLAISVVSENKICVVSANNGQLEKKSEIYCKYKPSAIHGLQNGDLCVLWEGPFAIGIISLCSGSYLDKVYFEKDTGGSPIRHNRRMAVDEDRGHVICSYKKENKQVPLIVGYDFDGNKIFEKGLAKIKDPRGMALDADGNIYICDLDLGAIHVLSPIGLHLRMIQEGCPRQPLGIGFKKSLNMFAVTQLYPDPQSVLFFSIRPP